VIRRFGSLVLAIVVLVGAGACTTQVEGVYFPTWLGLGGPTALGVGTLELRSGCIFIVEQGSARLVAWSNGFSLRGSARALELLWQGEPWARIGDRVGLGGGEISLERFRSLVGRPPPSECGAVAFWLATEPAPVPADLR
jgi:hypothetical protein